MSIEIGIVNSNKSLLKNLLTIFEYVHTKLKGKIGQLSIVHIKESGQAIDFAQYEFPDFIIVNIEQESQDSIDFLTNFNQDPWLHTTGIIIIYNEFDSEFFEELKNLNILSFLHISEINYQLSKILEILLTNQDFVYKKNVSEIFLQKKTGKFLIENDPSIVTSYVNILTSTLKNEKYINSNQENGLRIALTELIMNGIEHGNCKINHKQKSECLESGKSIIDLIRERNLEPAISKTRVTLHYSISDTDIHFTVEDCGDGFDHKNHVYDPNSITDLEKLHGRGIFMTMNFIDTLKYNEKGNAVTFNIMIEREQKKYPKAFHDQKTVIVKPGDIVFEENSKSNHLYYIVNGKYDVYVKGERIAELTPSDFFLGEMSFLLNNKRVASIKAATEGILIEIPKKSFINIIKRYPHYGLFLSKLLAKRLEKTNKLKIKST